MTSASIYAQLALGQAPRLLSLLDREPDSASHGSFDREHWAWKFRDFPLGMMQTAAYPLALLWSRPLEANPFHRSPQLREWIAAAIERTLARQHPNGAFDAFAPFEQDPGPTLGVVHGLCEAVRLLRDELPPAVLQRFLAALRRACDFALTRPEQETHAFISNHWALFAVTYLDAHELLGHPRYRERAGRIIERILREQSPDGWYNEYGGPDPGYESLGIHQLAVYWQRTGEARVLDSLRRAVEFYAHCVHPDGGVGGDYGSRHTALYFPGGFEMLSREAPRAASVAAFLRDRLARGNVVTPAIADPENLIPLLYSYLEAAHAAGETGAAAMPCQSLQGERRFEHSGIVVAGAPPYYAVVHTRKGGVCRIFDRREERIAYEDAGYLLRAGGRLWTSQLAGMSEPLPAVPGQAGCVARFARVQELLPTPARFLLLRLLNLTLFRSRALGNWLRNRIIARLILARHPGPFQVRREVAFAPDAVNFRDQLIAESSAQAGSLALPRRFAAIHMGSAKYFHPAELAATREAPLRGMLDSLNRAGAAENRFRVSFTAGCAGEPVRETATEVVAHR